MLAHAVPAKGAPTITGVWLCSTRSFQPRCSTLQCPGGRTRYDPTCLVPWMRHGTLCKSLSPQSASGLVWLAVRLPSCSHSPCCGACVCDRRAPLGERKQTRLGASVVQCFLDPTAERQAVLFVVVVVSLSRGGYSTCCGLDNRPIGATTSLEGTTCRRFRSGTRALAIDCCVEREVRREHLPACL